MAKTRILFRNWIAEMGIDPARLDNGPFDFGGEDESGLKREIIAKVSEALEKLEEDEKELIRQYYFHGRSLAEIAELTGRRQHRLEAIHTRAIRKLRRLLTPFVVNRFGSEVARFDKTDGNIDTTRKCPICRSQKRREIERIISGRCENETWGPVIKDIRRRFGICIKSPQQIIGHEKYHGPA